MNHDLQLLLEKFLYSMNFEVDSLRRLKCPADPRTLAVTLVAYFLISKHTKQLLVVTFCHTSAGIEAILCTHVHGQTHTGKDKQTWKLKQLFRLR